MEIFVADGSPAGVSSNSRAVASYPKNGRIVRPSIGEIGLDSAERSSKRETDRFPGPSSKSISPSWVKVTRAASNPGMTGWAETDRRQPNEIAAADAGILNIQHLVPDGAPRKPVNFGMNGA